MDVDRRVLLHDHRGWQRDSPVHDGHRASGHSQHPRADCGRRGHRCHGFSGDSDSEADGSEILRTPGNGAGDGDDIEFV